MNEFENQNHQSHVSDILQQIFRAYRIDDKIFELDVLSKWEEMMGKAVAIRTKKIYIKNKILYLSIESSVMRDELVYGKNVIIERVNSIAGKEIIQDVWFS